MDDAQADRDASLLLDMLLAARDARSFLSGLTEEAFMTSRLHQNAVIRSRMYAVNSGSAIRSMQLCSSPRTWLCQ